MHSRTALLSTILASLCLGTYTSAQTIPFAQPHARIVNPIDESETVTLSGNTHPLAAVASVSRSADESTPMEHMILFLKGDSNQDSQLEQLIAQQNNPKSPLYHQYLTPQQFGAQFGAAPADVEKVTAWLQGHGFTVEEVTPGQRAVVFSGTAGQVADAFKTEIRSYKVGGASHYANATDPQIPAALAETVGGVVKLHDFRHTAHISKTSPVSAAKLAAPDFTYGSAHYLSPADYGIIYDINPLYSAGVNGTGQTIAILARSNIYLSDVQTFRSQFGLKANDPQVVITNSDPGVLQGDSVETTLDTEWSGAVAPGATVKVIIAASTNSSDGIDLSALYAVNHNVAAIVSLSYGSCEAGMGSSELAYYNSLWQQAAAQGQSVFVSSGDSGAAGCNGGSDPTGSGQGINGLCSSPYSTCVGGTEFAEGSNPAQYWQPGNSSVQGSAISYIPETVWNESASNGGSGLWAGGGGASIAYSKPSWQTGSGVPADGKRDVPDVSMAAAGHDGYLIQLYGSLNSVGGTSAAAPSFAGIMALVDQKAGAAQGLANLVLYPLALNQSNGGAAVFHDITTGNNSVPGVKGFLATKGYDQGSGLGSVDANLLVYHWSDVTKGVAATLSLSASSSTLTVAVGKTVPVTITSTASATLKSAVALTVTGMPTGIIATFSSPTIASPGSGASTLNVTAASTVIPGTYAITVTGVGGGQTARVSVSVVVPTPTFTLTPSATSVTAIIGKTSQVGITSALLNGFSSAVALTVSGAPAGLTATLAPATIAAPGSGSVVVNITPGSTVAAGNYTLTVTAQGGGQTVKQAIAVAVPAPAFTMTASGTSVTTLVGKTASISFTTAVQNGFSSAVAFTATGTPAGLAATFSPSTVAAPGAGTAALNLAAGSSLTPGTYTLTITAQGGGQTVKATTSVVITAPTFTLSASAPSVTAAAGKTAQVALATTPQNGFSAPIVLSVAELPPGVTATFSPATLSGATAGTTTLTLTTATTVAAGSYTLRILATSGALQETAPVTLVVTGAPSCTLAATPASLSFTAAQTASTAVTCSSSQGTFTGPLALTLSGLPGGMAAQFGATTLTPGSSVPLTLLSTAVTPAGQYNLSLTASGGGFTKTITFPVTIAALNTFSILPSTTAINVKNGASGQVSFTSTHLGIFNSAVSFSIGGLPTGVTAAFSNTTIAAPGDGTVVGTFTVASSAKSGAYPVTITGNGGGSSKTATVLLTLGANQDFTLALGVSSLSMQQAASSTLVVSTGDFVGGFDSTIDETITGLPAGMSYKVTGATAANNMVNLSYLLTAASSTPAGTYPVTVVAIGAGITHSALVQVTVTASTATTKH